MLHRRRRATDVANKRQPFPMFLERLNCDIVFLAPSLQRLVKRLEKFSLCRDDLIVFFLSSRDLRVRARQHVHHRHFQRFLLLR